MHSKRQLGPAFHMVCSWAQSRGVCCVGVVWRALCAVLCCVVMCCVVLCCVWCQGHTCAGSTHPSAALAAPGLFSTSAMWASPSPATSSGCTLRACPSSCGSISSGSEAWVSTLGSISLERVGERCLNILSCLCHTSISSYSW